LQTRSHKISCKLRLTFRYIYDVFQPLNQMVNYKKKEVFIMGEDEIAAFESATDYPGGCASDPDPEEICSLDE